MKTLNCGAKRRGWHQSQILILLSLRFRKQDLVGTQIVYPLVLALAAVAAALDDQQHFVVARPPRLSGAGALASLQYLHDTLGTTAVGPTTLSSNSCGTNVRIQAIASWSPLSFRRDKLCMSSRLRPIPPVWGCQSDSYLS